MNIKVIQNLCGHSRSDVTLDIYTTVTKELKQSEFDDFQKKLKEKTENQVAAKAQLQCSS